jgi:DNA-binding GntR family transcriptional regulator
MFSKPFVASGRALLADDLYDYIQDAIVSGDLQPGERLVEEAVAQATSVSRTPVREALRRLKSAGLVTSSGRSFVVASMSSAELHELWVVMEHLQALATRMAASNRSRLDLVGLEQIVAAGREATEAGDVRATVELNRNFHDAIHYASGNSYLASLIAPIIMRIEQIQDFTSARTREKAQLQHEAILEAIADRDEARAEAAIRDHLNYQFATMAAPRIYATGRPGPADDRGVRSLQPDSAAT